MSGILHILDQKRLVAPNGQNVGGSIYFYTTGTLTPAAIYSDVELTTPLTNPVVVAAGGLVPAIYLDPDVTYRRRVVWSDATLTPDDVDPYTLPDSVTEAQAAADIAETERLAAESARAGADAARIGALAASVASQGYFPAARSHVPQGAVVGAATIGTAGSGGTNGTFALAFSGGNFAVNPTGTFTVAGGVVTAIAITGPGLYIGGSISAPTLSFAASSGLTGAAGTYSTTFLKTAGQYWLTDTSPTSSYLALFQNQADAAVEIDAQFAPMSAGTAESFANAGLEALAAADARLLDTFPIFADDPLYGQTVDVDSSGRVLFGLSSAGVVYGQSAPTFPIFADDPLYGESIAVDEDGKLVIGASTPRPASGKIIVLLGDSITANYGIPALVATLTGATVHNFAWGGSRVSSGGSAFANAYSVAAIAAAVASGNWTAIIAGVDADYPTSSATDVAARARVQAMAAFDWTTPDLIMILGGTNDWSAQVSLGAADSTTTTQFNGGLNEAIRQLQTARPAAQIALATPAWRGPLATLGDSNVNANGAGVFLSAFGDAIRANRWQLPVLDLARTLGINTSNKTLMLSDDLHPTTTGAARWAQRITTFINSLF